MNANHPPSLLGHSIISAWCWRFFALTLTGMGFALGATQDGALRMEVITAYNFVVDSNVESPSTNGPSAAHLGVRIYNDGDTPLTDVYVNIGDKAGGGPGVFASRTVDEVGQYSGTFALQMPGGPTDAVRYIPSIPARSYVAQYFFVTYPLKDGSGNSVTGSAPVTEDDLWLNYDIWASAGSLNVEQTTKVTMRNEISAMANKIWPNTDGKVPTNYLDAIEAQLGWRPDGASPRVLGATVIEGIWYDLGNVGAGFDNNGDGLPDRNAWLQPVGDPSKFSPLAARLVKCYGLVLVKLNDGSELPIAFEDRLYFENIPSNNIGAVGFVYYEFIPLDSSLPSQLTPYQEVASGYDNEKFNGDYGASGGSITSTPPDVVFDKSGPASILLGSDATYTLSATNNGSQSFGWPQLSLPLVFQDSIPDGLVYVAGSAEDGPNVPPSGQTFAVSWSTDDGATWVTTEPTAADVTTIRWTLSGSLAPTETATVQFKATVPTGYVGLTVDNTGCLRKGTETEFACDTVTTNVEGLNSVGDFVWRDLNRDGVQDVGEPGIPNITVSLYYDTDGDGELDPGEPLLATDVTDASGGYLFSALPDGKFIVVVDAVDADVPVGFNLADGVAASISVDLDSAGAIETAVDVLTADWPFIKSLEVTKSVSPTSYYGGELITYTINLDNHMSTLQPPQPNLQTAYATSTTFDKTNAADYTTRNEASGAPNNIFTSLDWNANADKLTSTGITPTTFIQSGDITKVELIVRGYQSLPLPSSSTMTIDIGHSLRTIATIATRTNTQMNALVGVSQDLVVDITAAKSGTFWTWEEAQSLSAALSATKTSGQGASGNYYIDSIGFRVTTNNTPFAGTFGDSTITEWPLVDTYDPAKLEFVSASVLPDVQTPGRLEWNNLGPVNAGARKTITVTFRAKTPLDTNGDGTRDPMTATNDVSTEGHSEGFVPRFPSGLPAGHDDGTVDVTILPAGRIGDFVYWDVNGNNSFGTGDLPLKGVIVQLYRDSGGGVFVYTGRSQITDSAGWYEFSGLVDGTYQVRITTETGTDLFTLPWTSFSSTQRGTVVTSIAQPTSVAGDSVPINNADTLTTNDTNFLQDFGFDSNASLISGTLFRDWNGNGVQDPGDEPLVGYTVTLSGGTARTVTTDANGFYQFTNITATVSHTVTVTAPPSGHVQTLDPDGTMNNATTITVAQGAAYTGNDFAYQPSGSLTLGDTVYYDWSGNGTQDNGETGIANVDMRLYEDGNGDGIIAATDALIATVTTNEFGVYQFTGLAAGNYIVAVVTSDPDFPGQHIQTQDYDPLIDDKAKVNLTVNNPDVDFGYLPTGTGSIGNLVWNDVNNDGLKDVSESGIDGVTVELYRSGQIPGTDTPFATTTTSGGGLYSFSSLPAGSGYVVYLPAANFTGVGKLVGTPLSSTTTGTTDDSVDNDDNGIQSGGSGGAVSSPLITLDAAESDQTIDFGFVGAGSVGDFVFYDLNGNGQQDYNETGIAGVTVNIFLDANADGIADSGTPLATEVTADGTGLDPAGFYRFDDLTPGTYFVEVVTGTGTPLEGMTFTADPDRDGVPVGTEPLLPAGDNADSLVIVTSGSNYSGADFGYQPSGAIGDFVWLDLNQDGVQDPGEPGIAGVVIEINDGVNPVFTVTTDFDGYWGAVVADGTTTVTVLASNFAVDGPLEGYAVTYDADGGTVTPDGIVVTVVTSGDVDLGVGNLGIDFGYKLDGSLTLSGTVAINDTGTVGTADDPTNETELEGVEVFLYTSSGTFLGSKFTDASGDYSFTGLPDGSYKVIIGTTAAPLDYSTLTTTSANNAAVNTVTDTGTSVRQELTISASVSDVDFMFVSSVDYDFGDLPASYEMTTIAQDGARHIVPVSGTTVYLGTIPDTEADGQTSAAADGDDTLGTAADEDGVTVTSQWVEGTNGGQIQVSVTGSGWLVVWIDWNNDGNFLGADELIVTQAVSTGTSTISFDIPAGAIADGAQDWFSRFRVFTSEPALPQFSYVGVATNGEVEDYLLAKPLGASIGDFVWKDYNGDGVQDAGEPGIAGVRVFIDSDSDGTYDVGEPYAITNSAGAYLIELAAGTYSVVVDASGLPDHSQQTYDLDATLDNKTSVILSAGQALDTADFGYDCFGTWEEWQFLNPLGGSNGPADNPDGDNHDNLIEYAFSQPADSGVGDPFCIAPSGDTLIGEFTRPTGATVDVTYYLEYTAVLSGTTSWTRIALTPEMITVVDNGNCTETVTINDLETLTGLTSGEGFVRMLASLDGAPPENTTNTSYTEVEGWTETAFPVCCKTYNNPYLRCALFTGTVTAVSGQELTFGASSGTVTLDSNYSYYLEVTSGTYEGHRFDVTAVSGSPTTVTVDPDSDLCSALAPYNTLTGAPPAGLVTATAVLRRHWTLREMFPVDGFYADPGFDPALSDQIQTFANGVWTTYYLYDADGAGGTPAKWVLVPDAGLVDKGLTVIPPGQGLFVNKRSAATSILVYGEVRENDFIRPLCSGSNLVGGGYPIDQSANGTGGRDMNLASLFFATRDFKSADSIFIWKGDAVAGASGYDTYYLLTGSPAKWVKVGDIGLTSRDAESLLIGDRSAFIRVRDDLHSYTIPSPWTP